MQSARVNYPQEVEQAINQAVQVQQQAAHTYDHLAAACASEELSMPGFCKFFRLCSQRQRRVAEHLINVQTTRGGKFFVPEIKPLVQLSNDLYKQPIAKIVELALETEKKVEQSMRQIYQIAQSKQDMSTMEYVEKKLITLQLTVIKMLVNHVNGLRVSENAYLYDRVTMMALVKNLRAQIQARLSQQFTFYPYQQQQFQQQQQFYANQSGSGVAAFVYPF